MIPKVTVLVAVRNSEKFIRGCLDSLLTQTIINDTEIIVIEGDSQEDEKEIVLQYQKHHPQIKYIFTKKLGLYHAWNLGIRASKAKYITNLNADDRLKKDALEIMAKYLNKHPEVALVYGDDYVTSKPNETFDNNSSNGRCFRNPDYTHKELLIHCLCGPHPMWRRKLHDELGYFDESYKIAGDYEFWLRIAEKYKLLHILKIIGLYYENLNGLTLSNLDLTYKENLRIKPKYFYSK